MDAFLTWNIYDYENVIPPPKDIPSDKTFYLTDTDENAKLAEKLGWNKAFVTNAFKERINNAHMREALADIKCYTEVYVPDIKQFDRLFLFDSDVVVLDSNYSEFVKKSSPEYALYVSSGYAKGDRDCIQEELKESVENPRWSYGVKQMNKSVGEYITCLNDMGLSSPSIVSAKYTGWNLKHKMRKEIADWIYGEYMKHLQGNIIYTMASVIFEEYVFNYRDFINDGALQSHRSYDR